MDVRLSKSQRRKINRQNRAQTNMVMVPTSKAMQVQPVKSRQVQTFQVVQSSIPNPSGGRRRKTKSRKRSQNSRNEGGYASNWYLKSLIDPIGVTGSKVPDEESFPSSTYHSRAIYPGLNSSLARGRYLSGVKLTPVLSHYNTGLNPLFEPVQMLTYDQGLDEFVWDNLTLPGADTLLNAAQAYRPVSASIRATTAGSVQNTGGYWVAGMVPRGLSPDIHGTSFQIPRTLDIASNGFLSEIVPTTIGDWVEALWRPLDNSNTEYIDTISSNTDPLDLDETFFHVPSIYLIFVASTSESSPIFEVNVNYEYIPEDDFSSISNAKSSPSSFKMMEEASNVLGKFSSVVKSTMKDEVKSLAYDLSKRAVRSMFTAATPLRLEL